MSKNSISKAPKNPPAELGPIAKNLRFVPLILVVVFVITTIAAVALKSIPLDVVAFVILITAFVVERIRAAAHARGK